jgi:hypothetical protein
MEGTTMEGTTMEGTTMNKLRKNKSCSICGQQGHNKRSCPQKPIDDTFVRGSSEQSEYIEIEESVSTTSNEDILIALLVEGQEYGIDPDIFVTWYTMGRPCPLKNIKHTMNQGISKYYMTVYLKLISFDDTY